MASNETASLRHTGTPVYTTKAYVFYVSPENRESWIQTSKKAIDVSFVIVPIGFQVDNVSSPARRELKLVAINDETGETILDDVITNTKFDQRSLKFCQWMDNKRLLWGLGFDQEGPLEEFMNRFDVLKQELAQPQPQPVLPPVQQPIPRQQTGSTSSHQSSPKHLDQQQQIQSQQQRQKIQYENHETAAQQQHHQANPTPNGQPFVRSRLTSSVSLTKQLNQQQISSGTLPPRAAQQYQQQYLSNGNSPIKTNGNVSNNAANSTGLITGQHSRSHSTIGYQSKSPDSIGNRSSGDVSQQLTNIEQLKYENERLKQALEEISNNAGLWHNELINLRTNNVKLTQALQESKSNVEEWQIELASLRDENKDLKLRLRESTNEPDQKDELLEYIDKLRKDVTAKDQDIEKLRSSLDELTLSKQKNEDQINNNISSKLDQHQKQAFVSIQNRMDMKISELKAISQELTMVVDKISQ